MDDAGLERGLARALGARMGPVVIDGLARLTGGASRETWSFTARDAAGEKHRLVLQRNRGGGDLGLHFDDEDRLLAAAAAARVPIPEVVVDATGCTALGDGRITAYIDGETLGPRIVRAPRFEQVRPVLVRQMANALAAIHTIPIDRVPGLAEVDPVSMIRAGLDGLGIVSPAFELALVHLDAHRPVRPRRCVLHGDFRVGNLIVDETGLRAVLDWELAHLGDPVEDLGWLCVRAWRFGGPGEVGGIGDVADLLAAYGEASGVEVAEDDLRWWMIAGTLRWGLICAVQAGRHLDGRVASVELATIGRRIAENEHDVLDLMDIPPHPPGVSLPKVDQGRPSAAELIAAVRSHLTDNVVDGLSGRVAFTTRVAANALGVVERELAASPPTTVDVDEAELAGRIRSGGALDQADLAAIRAAVTARIAVANPRWADRASADVVGGPL